MIKNIEFAMDSKAWPFQEARSLLKRVKGVVPDKGHVLFETGYGPSGLPHIGTFGEVARTTMVRRYASFAVPRARGGFMWKPFSAAQTSYRHRAAVIFKT